MLFFFFIEKDSIHGLRSFHEETNCIYAKKWDFEPYFSQILDSRTGKYQCQTSACAMCSIQFCNDETFSIHLPHFIGKMFFVNTNKGQG